MGSEVMDSDGASLLRNRYTGGGSENTKNRGRRRRRRNRRGSTVSLPRMIDRNLPFHQSRNKMNMRNLDPQRYLWKLQIEDWFHSLLRLHSCVSVGILLLTWTIIVGIFAAIYWFQDNVHYRKLDCGLGVTETESLSYSGAFSFSLETSTTVGYGLPGSSTSFFEKGCSAVQATIFAEMMFTMMFNAFLFAFFFSLLSKSEKRGSQIIFTNKLLINVDQGTIGSSSHDDETAYHSKTKAYVRLQCYDIDSAHPLVEAHARMYFLDHRLKMHPLRLMDPNDDLGGVLFPSAPADIVHHIDYHSALCPPKFRHHNNCPLVQSSHGLVLRSLDSYTGNRDEIICPVCGESFGTYRQFKQHFDYVSMVEARENYPPEKSHYGYVLPPEPEPITLEELKHYIANTVSEIIVVVEAIDPQMSGTFQSLQSYKYEDIVFGEEFENCMSIQKDGHSKNRGEIFCVDMNQFHATTTRHGKLKCESFQSETSEEEEEESEDEHEENLRSYRTFFYSARQPNGSQKGNQELVVQERMPFFATIV